MNTNKAIKILRYAMIFLLLTTVYFSITYKFHECNTCKLAYNDKKLNGAEFMQEYANKCFSKNNNPQNVKINYTGIGE